MKSQTGNKAKNLHLKFLENGHSKDFLAERDE